MIFRPQENILVIDLLQGSCNFRVARNVLAVVANIPQIRNHPYGNVPGTVRLDGILLRKGNHFIDARVNLYILVSGGRIDAAYITVRILGTGQLIYFLYAREAFFHSLLRFFPFCAQLHSRIHGNGTLIVRLLRMQGASGAAEYDQERSHTYIAGIAFQIHINLRFLLS